LILRKIIKTVATRCHYNAPNLILISPDPLGGAQVGEVTEKRTVERERIGRKGKGSEKE